MFSFFKRGNGPTPNDLQGRPIGRVLTKMGKVTQPQVVEALTLQRSEGGKLGEILVRLGYITPEDVDAALAAQRGVGLMPQGYYTIEQWTRRGWREVAVLPFGMSLTAAEREVQQLGRPGFYRLLQMQRVIWAERDGSGLRLRRSHASSPTNLQGMAEMFDRTDGWYPLEEVQAARREQKRKRQASRGKHKRA